MKDLRIYYIGIKNKIGIPTKLKNMGYRWQNSSKEVDAYDDNYWIFISIHVVGYIHGSLLSGSFNPNTDVEMDIDNIPLRKDLDEWVKMIDNGTKLGLL